jgi:GT2 family glycosyltransferase
MADNLELSIIILNYNTAALLDDCLKSLGKVRREADFEIIVADNGSTDSSTQMLSEKYPGVKLVKNGANLGFAKGNNAARGLTKGEFVLFLNTDTLVKKETLAMSLAYLRKNKQVGALTCKLVLPDGTLDKDARRSFPTPWVAFTHLVLPLDGLFPKSKLFARYWYGYKSPDEVHQTDVIQGAFFLVRKEVLDNAGWFDEDYFLDGEDIDLCWKIKQLGWKIVYYPKVEIIHLKGITKGKNKKTLRKVSLKEKMKFRMSGVNSMEIFYRKRLWPEYPLLLNYLVIVGIKLVKLQRLVKLILQ